MITTQVGVSAGRRPEDAHDEEYQFLQYRQMALEAELEERNVLLEYEFPDGIGVPRGQAEWSRLWQRELEFVRTFTGGIAHTALERLLRRRLRQVQRRLARLSTASRYRGVYPPEYWQAEEERQILTGLLRRWWEWRDGPLDGLDYQV